MTMRRVSGSVLGGPGVPGAGREKSGISQGKVWDCDVVYLCMCVGKVVMCATKPVYIKTHPKRCLCLLKMCGQGDLATTLVKPMVLH